MADALSSFTMERGLPNRFFIYVNAEDRSLSSISKTEWLVPPITEKNCREALYSQWGGDWARIYGAAIVPLY